MHKGEVITIHGRIVKAGTTSLMVHVRAVCEIAGSQNVEGFITFVCVEPDSDKTVADGIVRDNTSCEFEQCLRERAIEVDRRAKEG